jgi:tetratricopeptide (TPR) repeat protein
LTDVVDELTAVSIAYNELELKYPQSVHSTVVNLRRNHNMRRRYLANHGEFLAEEIPTLTSDVDYVSLAHAFEQGGDYTKAQRFYELAIEKAPTNLIKMWNLRAFARFWFTSGNAGRARKTYQQSLELELPDTDSIRRDLADTHLLWSRLEDEHGYVDEAKRLRTLGQQAAHRIGNSKMKENMLKHFSEETETSDAAPITPTG